MGKIGMFIGAVLLAFGLQGMAWAVPIAYNDTVVFPVNGVNNELTGSGTFSWSHDVTDDFSLPPDTLISANLTITSRRAADGDDLLYLVDFDPSLFLGSLDATGNSPVITSFDLEGLGVFSADWLAGQTLDLSLSYAQGNGPSNTLTMVSSVFTLEYDNNNNASHAAAIPTPEPSTVVLLGSGLVGLLYMGRRKSRK